MFLFTDTNVFEEINAAWVKRVEDNNFENIDPPLIPILHSFNKIPGVASFMSCMSHPEDFTEGKKKLERHHTFYITYAFTQDGFHNITSFFALLRHAVRTEWPNHSSGSAGPRSLVLSFSSRPMKDGSGWWNSGGLSMRLNAFDPSVRDRFLHILEDTLREYTRPYNVLTP